MKEGLQGIKPRILVVDDMEANLLILSRIIESLGYIALTAKSVKQAILILQKELPQIILTDLSMPDMNGYDFIYLLKENQLTKDIPVIIVSGLDSSPDKVRGFKAGAVDFIPKPFEVEEVKVRLATHLKIYSMQQEMEMCNQKLNVMVQKQMFRIEEEQRNILYALARLTEFSDAEGGYSHLSNVSNNARILAESLSLTLEYEDIVTTEFVDTIEIAALLHDIGKISVPTRILGKPGKLSKAEQELIQEHTSQGARIIHEIQRSCGENRFLKMAERIALSHHERWDGLGYPNRIKGEDIPLEARIINIVGVFDVLTNEQVYRSKISRADALEIMENEAGKSFDPKIFQIFGKIIKQLH
ncbi:HD domain-containing phosphohydrolase [Anaerosporobacter faecicola]|uniref:HD domain-containing phosphohydrolase n=1 Tax=Anaerosporobacter faecicola TaxID=2718714 RepID=UPI001439132F|nr:HD domain-containing phosphohydrolase [Anaerosporobacter faecicola]